ncbi:MAG: hypothetical protein ABEI86_03670 [Halobacteriaceae archaeon]
MVVSSGSAAYWNASSTTTRPLELSRLERVGCSERTAVSPPYSLPPVAP